MAKKEKTVEEKIVDNTLRQNLTDDQYRIARKQDLKDVLKVGAVPTSEEEERQIMLSKQHDRDKLVMDLAIASVYLQWLRKEIDCVENTIKWFDSRKGILQSDIIVRNAEGIALNRVYFVYMYHHKIIYYKKLVTQYKWDLDSAKISHNIVPSEVDLKVNDMLSANYPPEDVLSKS